MRSSSLSSGTMKNSIFVIKPYKWEGHWVFDDPAVGLVRDLFVGGADLMIDYATRHIPNADRGSLAVFSASYFPDAQIVLEWVMKSSFQEVVTGRGSSLLAASASESASAASWLSKHGGQSSLSLSNSLEATSASHWVQVPRQSLQHDNLEKSEVFKQREQQVYLQTSQRVWQEAQW